MSWVRAPPSGLGHPKTGTVLQGHTPRTQHSTELVWQHWGEEEEEARKAHLPAWLCLCFAAPLFLPDPLGLTLDFWHPDAATFPKTLDFGQHACVPPRKPPPLAPGPETCINFHPG